MAGSQTPVVPGSSPGRFPRAFGTLSRGGKVEAARDALVLSAAFQALCLAAMAACYLRARNAR